MRDLHNHTGPFHEPREFWDRLNSHSTKAQIAHFIITLFTQVECNQPAPLEKCVGSSTDVALT